MECTRCDKRKALFTVHYYFDSGEGSEKAVSECCAHCLLQMQADLWTYMNIDYAAYVSEIAELEGE